MATYASLIARADAIDAAIDAFIADGAIQQYTTAQGTTVQRAPIPDLIKLRDSYLQRAASLQSGGAVNNFRRGSA